MEGFDKHLRQVLRKNPELAKEYAKLIAKLPLTTQLSLMRRRLALSQIKSGQKMGKPQSVVARLERPAANPRLSTLQEAAAALDCSLVLVPNKALRQVARVACRQA